jgi:hypothetical protein
MFAIGSGAAVAMGASTGRAWTVGMLAAAPLAVAFIWERVTGVKAFGVEVTLAEVSPPMDDVPADLAQSVGQDPGYAAIGSDVGPASDSGVSPGTGGLSDLFAELINSRAKLLRVNLRDDDYWWSTRLFLVAALAQDYTQVRSLVFVRKGDEQIFVGIADPRDVRKRLAEMGQADHYESAYRKACATVSANPGEPGATARTILENWPNAISETLGYPEGESPKVSSAMLRFWMGADLDTQSVPAGPLTAHKQYRIIGHDRRYVALTDGFRLADVVDRDELVIAAQIERRLRTGGKR